MKRLSVLLAALLACAVIAATPAIAQERAAVPTAASTVVALPGGMHQNWFSDWNTCIWGIGTPTALAWRYPATAKQVAYGVLRSRDRAGLVRVYGQHVISACERFIRS